MRFYNKIFSLIIIFYINKLRSLRVNTIQQNDLFIFKFDNYFKLFLYLFNINLSESLLKKLNKYLNIVIDIFLLKNPILYILFFKK